LSGFPKKSETKVKRLKKKNNSILKTLRSSLKRKRIKSFSKEETCPKIFNSKKRTLKNQRKRKPQKPRRIRKPQKMKTNKTRQSSTCFPKKNQNKTIVFRVISQLIKAQVLSCSVIEGSNTLFKFSSMITSKLKNLLT
jgi:hypothetical protein